MPNKKHKLLFYKILYGFIDLKKLRRIYYNS